MTTKNTRKSATKPKRKSRSLELGTGSAFRDWFLEQAGKPIMSEADYIKLRSETIPSLRFQLALAKTQLAEMNRYRIAQQYALYAWIAKPNVKAEPRRFRVVAGRDTRRTQQTFRAHAKPLDLPRGVGERRRLR